MIRRNPYYQSYLWADVKLLNKYGKLQNLSTDFSFNVPADHRERLNMPIGEKVHVGVTRQGLAMAISPEIISKKLLELGENSNNLSQKDRDLLRFLYEDFRKHTDLREMNKGRLIIPKKIREILKIKNQIVTAESEQRLIARPVKFVQRYGYTFLVTE